MIETFSLKTLWQDSDLKKTVDESARIQRAYNHYFDLIIINDNLDKAFEKLQTAIEKLRMEPQWVPISWVYWWFNKIDNSNKTLKSDCNKPSTERIHAQIDDICQVQAFLLCRLKYQYTILNFYIKCGWEGVLIYNLS